MNYKIILIVCLFLFPININADPAYTNEEHLATEFYPQTFSVRAFRTDQCSLFIQTSIFDDILSTSIIDEVTQTVSSFKEFLNIDISPIEIYIVKEPANGAIQVLDNRLYCTAQDIMKRTYTKYLASSMTQCEYWKSIGLNGLFLQEIISGGALSAFYNGLEDMDILSLSPFWFNDSLTSAEEKRYAEETALSLTQFLTERDGMETFLTTDYMDIDRTQWLQSIGVNKEYNDIYQNIESRFILMPSKTYDVSAISQKYNMAYNIVSITGQSDSPTLVRCFLYEAENMVEEVLNWISREAPEYYERCSNNLQFGSRVYVNLDGTRSTVKINHIFLKSYINFADQFMYILVPVKTYEYNTPLWVYNGLYGAVSMRFSSERMDAYYQSWLKYALENYSDSSHNQDKDINELLYYAACMLGTNDFLDNVGTADVFDAFALCQLDHDFDDAVWQHHPVVRKDQGNELSDFQVASFTNYLINKYSLDKVLQFCFSQPIAFASVFGCTYKSAKDDWIVYLQNRLVRISR